MAGYGPQERPHVPHRDCGTFMVAGEGIISPPRMRRGGPDQEDTMKQLLLLATLMLLAGCAPEVGSKAWCEAMDAKAKGDWTANEATDYAKHCLFR